MSWKGENNIIEDMFYSTGEGNKEGRKVGEGSDAGRGLEERVGGEEGAGRVGG